MGQVLPHADHEHRLVDKENETGNLIFEIKDLSCCWGSCFVCLGAPFLSSGSCRSTPCEGAMADVCTSASMRSRHAQPTTKVQSRRSSHTARSRSPGLIGSQRSTKKWGGIVELRS